MNNQIIWKTRKTIIPAQSFDENKAYFCVYLNLNGQLVPHLITSDKEFIAIDEKSLPSLDFVIKNGTIPTSNYSCWDTNDDKPFSVYDFLFNNPQADIVEIFLKNRSYFVEYADYVDDRYRDLLAIWSMSTYFHQLFDTFPYLALTGTKRSGKTRTLEIISELAFNSMIAASISSASMYRAVNNNRCTILFDESENLCQNPQFGDLMEVLKSGYKKSGSTMRCQGDNHQPVEFSTYSPKVFANINGIERTLADRTIPIRMVRTNANNIIPPWRPKQIANELTILRNTHYVMAMQYHQKVNEIYQSDILKIGLDTALKDREKELWDPILTLSLLIDEEAQRKHHDWESITQKLLQLSSKIRQNKESRENAEQAENLLIEALLQFIEVATPVRDSFYNVQDIVSFVSNCEGLKWINSHQKLWNQLENLQIVQNREIDSQRLRRQHETKQFTTYRLERECIIDAAERYGVKIKQDN